MGQTKRFVWWRMKRTGLNIFSRSFTLRSQSVFTPRPYGFTNRVGFTSFIQKSSFSTAAPQTDEERTEAILSLAAKIKKDDVAPHVKDVVKRFLGLNAIGLQQFTEIVSKRINFDPSQISAGFQTGRGAAASGSASAAAEEAPAQPADSGMRKVVIKEITGGMKEKLAIMKVLRTEQPELSLADCKKLLDKLPATLFDKID